MHYQIIIKWKNKRRKLTLPAIIESQGIVRIIKSLFVIKGQDLVGVTDKFNKFYDMIFFADNMKMFNNQEIELISSQDMECDQIIKPLQDQNDLNIDPISFASNTPGQFQNDYNPLKQDSGFQEHFQLPSQGQYQQIGQIHDLKLFEDLILQSQLTIIIQNHNKPPKLKFQFYHLKGKSNRVIIYYSKKRVCEVPIFSQNWQQTQKLIENLIKSITKNNNQSQQHQQNFIQKFNQDELFPFSYNNKGQKQQRKKQYSKEKIKPLKQQQKNLFVKQKNQQERSFKFFQSSSDEIQNDPNQRYNIPIIIRKSNNKIQKVMASYPLSSQQINAINSLLQLQIQGLFSDQQINKVKMMILGQNPRILQLFQQYGNQNLSVNQLCQNLSRSLRRKDSIKK